MSIIHMVPVCARFGQVHGATIDSQKPKRDCDLPLALFSRGVVYTNIFACVTRGGVPWSRFNCKVHHNNMVVPVRVMHDTNLEKAPCIPYIVYPGSMRLFSQALETIKPFHSYRVCTRLLEVVAIVHIVVRDSDHFSAIQGNARSSSPSKWKDG
jgi:hypothetical protein